MTISRQNEELTRRVWEAIIINLSPRPLCKNKYMFSRSNESIGETSKSLVHLMNSEAIINSPSLLLLLDLHELCRGGDTSICFKKRDYKLGEGLMPFYPWNISIID